MKRRGNISSSRLLLLTTETDLEALSAESLNHLASHSGRSPSCILAEGGRIYALEENGAICCQVNINFGELLVNTPMPLRILLPHQAFFVSFLYTPKEQRGKGYARSLLSSACQSLMDEKYNLGICHIRSTNVSSRVAFQQQGWCRSAAIIYTTLGTERLLATPGVRKLGINIINNSIN